MKLVRCDHYRCAELDGTTYLIAPDDTTEEQLEKDAQEAADWQIEAIIRWRTQHERPTSSRAYKSCITDYPDDMTMREAKALQERDRKEAEKLSQLERDATKEFSEYMRQRGYIPLWEYDGEDTLSTPVSWGHSHGLSLKMSDGHPTDYKACEKPAPKRRILVAKEVDPPPPPDPPPARIINEGVSVGVEKPHAPPDPLYDSGGGKK